MPDITAIVPPKGRAFLIECKVGGDRVRTAQDAFMEAAGMNGAFCAVVRSLADLEGFMDELRSGCRA